MNQFESTADLTIVSSYQKLDRKTRAPLFHTAVGFTLNGLIKSIAEMENVSNKILLQN